MSAVEARPPSLYVTVETATWAEMNADDRTRLIGEVGKVIEPNGYQGARIQSDTGKPLARWLRTRGAMLIVHNEETVRPRAR